MEVVRFDSLWIFLLLIFQKEDIKMDENLRDSLYLCMDYLEIVRVLYLFGIKTQFCYYLIEWYVNFRIAC